MPSRSTRRVFGWTHSEQPFGEGEEYTQFEHDGQPIAGALEMDPQIPAETPSYWLIYFTVDDVDAGFQKAMELGAARDGRPEGHARWPIRHRQRSTGRRLRHPERPGAVAQRARARWPSVAPAGWGPGGRSPAPLPLSIPIR